MIRKPIVRAATWLCTLTLLAWAAQGFAQQTPAPVLQAQTESDAPQAGAEAEEPTAPPTALDLDEYERGTPRSAVVGYLKAARAGEWERAAHYLDLRPVPDKERESRGPELARQLKTVLDRTLWVDVEQLSAEAEGHQNDGLAPRRDLVGVIESGRRGKIPVNVERQTGPQGREIWQIAATTVARIPALDAEFGNGVLARYLPPIFFDTQLFEVQLWQWIALGLLLFVAWLGSWLFVQILAALVHPIVSRTERLLDDQFFQATLGPLRLALAATIGGAAATFLGLAVPVERFVLGLLRVIGIAAATWFALRVVDLMAEIVDQRLRTPSTSAASQLVPLGRKTVKVAIVALAVLAGLDSFGFDVTAVVAGLGIGGIAVALGLQKTLENLFGGATVLADRPVRVGDFCRFGDRVGTVEEIGLRSTRVRTLDRTVVSVPNAEFSAMQLENFGRRDKIWYHPTIGLRYETTPDQLRYVLVEIRKMLYAHAKVDPDPARIRFTAFGAYSLDLEIFAYVTCTDYGEFLEIAEDLNLRIMDIVEAAGTGFAFPSSTTYLGKDEGLDAERRTSAENQVEQWRASKELCLPSFPPEKIRELRSTLDYPPEGSAGFSGTT